VGGDADDTSGAIFLNGSDAWTDYLFTANVDWESGHLLALIARWSNYNDYLECDFTGNGPDSEHIDVYRVFNGVSQSMGDQGIVPSNVENGISKNDIEVSMKVSGDNVECGIGDTFFIENDLKIGLNPALLQGGIGFKTWDPDQGNSQVIVKSVSVTPLY
jgi:hypothetical protein